jgi:hypothetical protein
MGKVETMKRDWLHVFSTMNKKYLTGFLATIVFVAGCSTESLNQNLGGVATASALVIALPLIPFALPFSVIEQSKERKKDEALYAKLDPVYQKRIEMIKARSPRADAEQAWNEKMPVFLPTTHGGDNYWGLGTTEYNLKNGEENQKQIDANKFLTYLQTLLSDDPLQQQVQIWNKKYLNFLDARLNYEKAFNLEIYQKIQDSKVSGTK